MQKLLSILKKRNASDTAAATLVVGIVSILFLCLCMGFALDLTKNAYIKNAQTSKAQESVEAAVKTVDSRGSLANFNMDKTGQIPDVVYKVASAYKDQNSANYNNSLVGEGDHLDDAASFNSEQCSTRNIIKWGSSTPQPAKLPYMVVKVDQTRGFDNATDSVVYTIEGNEAPIKRAGNFRSGASYHVVSAEIHDASANFMMGMFGMPCQSYTSKVSAISFGSQQDLANGGQ